MPGAPDDDRLLSVELSAEVVVDPLHHRSGLLDIVADSIGQVGIPDHVGVRGGDAEITEHSKDRRVVNVGGGLQYFLLDHNGTEAKPACNVFQSARGKVVNVFGVEFLERRREKFGVASGVRRFEVEIAAWYEYALDSSEQCTDVVDVLEDVTEHDAIKFRHIRRGRRDGANMSGKAALAASGGTTRRRIKSGQ